MLQYSRNRNSNEIDFIEESVIDDDKFIENVNNIDSNINIDMNQKINLLKREYFK